ncbi:tetratricopeptide repeat protein [Phaeodactylibacter xiamenensis]|uniref:tetratricopeptide repeat protein n=1 Tax=Phaeodactylibacter xiamenensis TaxID=1524460 RepID=UPI0024A9F36E|nr:hypothetical protein [Phaeodactylibacter xiamenensis]
MNNEFDPITEQEQDLIFRYYEGEMSEVDKQEFTQLLGKDNFRQAWEQQAYLQKGLSRELQDEDLRKTIKAVADRYHEAEARRAKTAAAEVRPLSTANRPARILRWAAGFLLMVALGGVLWANLNYSDSAIAQSFQEPLLSTIVRSAEAEQQVFRAGRQDFFNGRYQQAEEAMMQISPESPNFPEAQALLAYSLFYQKKYEPALQYFDQLLQVHFSQLPEAYKSEEKLRWSRLLALLGIGAEDSLRFREELDFFLKGKSTFYAQKAERLRQKLDSPFRIVLFD